MKKTLVALGCIFALSANAQTPAKSIFFELGGPGVASLNYDMRFTKSESGIGGRIGIGGFSIGTAGERTSTIFIPIGVNYLIGKDGKNYFELGGGVTPVLINDSYNGTSDNFTSTFGHLNFGYRLQPKNSGFTFRAAINPVLGKGFFWPYYGGVSFGYKF
ncbi:MAG: hypothetical protein IPP48_14615 [Chitinophagaceae bacterium]|nr:hypothetical protein [Chitinophagaceae bacterium]